TVRDRLPPPAPGPLRLAGGVRRQHDRLRRPDLPQQGPSLRLRPHQGAHGRLRRARGDRPADRRRAAGRGPRRHRRREHPMTTALLTAYVLVWPAIVAGVLLVIVRAFVRELRRARAEGRRII